MRPIHPVHQLAILTYLPIPYSAGVMTVMMMVMTIAFTHSLSYVLQAVVDSGEISLHSCTDISGFQFS